MRKLTKSLKFRLILLLLPAIALPGIIMRMGLVGTYSTKAISLRKSDVVSQARILANQVGSSGYMDVASAGSESIQAQINLLTSIYDGRVLLVDPAYRIIYDTYNIDDNRTVISEDVIQSFGGEEITNYDPDNHYIEITLPVTDPEDASGTIAGVMLVSVSTDKVEMTKGYMGQIGWVIWGVSTVLLFTLGLLGVVLLIRPFGKLSEAVKGLKESYEYENVTLEVNDYTETAEICQRINELVSRTKVINDSRQEFVSNVSHELKTPLTSMKVLADSINSMPDAPKELYQEFFGDIASEVERETKIINDLLSLVRMDKQASDMNISSMNINELLEQILKRLQPIADRQKVELVLESFRPVTAEVDEVKLTLAITNLVENAIKYNKTEGGWVHVTLNADHQYFFLKVEDNGIGIPEDSLEHIYERFYRVDKSHSREIGGTGLGLAITRNCILMHKGAIKAFSVQDEGTTFDVRIPLTYIA